MELEWIEDFLAVAEERSFSRAANLRNSSQSAFSRRIQSLETWVGVDLIDRTRNPPTLTPAGRTFRGFASGMVHQLYQARNILRGKIETPEREIKFAVAFTLSLTFFPTWFSDLHAKHSQIAARVSEMNVMDGATALVAGEVDFLVCYHHPLIPVLLDIERSPYISLGIESIQPYSACDESGRPAYTLPGTADQPIPFLSYTAGTFFVHVVDMVLLNSPTRYFLNHCYQSQMSEAIKAMVVAGNGVGWLPEKCVTRELREGKIVDAGSDKWRTQLEIRIYRSAANHRPIVENLWDYLIQHKTQ
ncbi:MAG: LysR family transcriptional regulator [Pseudomonadota bacterium]